MSYINFRKRLDRVMDTFGTGLGTLDMGVAGVSITGATTATPTVLTAAGHPYNDGDWIWIDGATGTTEINGLRKVTNSDTNDFELLDEAGVAVGSAGSFGGTVDSNLALVYKPGSTEVAHIARLNGSMADASYALDGFGGVTRLTNGLIVAVYDSSGIVQTLATVKGWNDWALYTGGADVSVNDITNAKIEFGMRWTFGRITEQSQHVTDLRINGNDGEFLAIYTQDDLDGLTSLRFAVNGYLE
jgi:hypothetical protein